MVIKINYTSSDVYVSTSVSPVYVVVNYSGVSTGGGVWGQITGTLSNQTDLQTALDAKFDDPTGTTAQYLRGDGSLATFPSLTGYVPYTGATTNVNLGEFELKAGQVEFDQTPTGTAGVGVMRWNDSDGTIDLGLKGGNVTLQVGQEQVQRVVNKSGINLLEANYQVVRVSDAQGQRLAVQLAQGNNDANSTDTIGIVTETINDNQEGFVTTSGLVRNINTTGSLQGETWIDGDVLYLSPTVAGRITKVKPTAPNHSVILGYVVYAHANNGKIFVKVDNGYEIGELHDVYVPTPSNNDGIFWNTANSRYQNNSIAGVLGYTPISGSGATGQVAYWNGTNSQTGSNNLFWDAANARLGIGTNTPSRKLHVIGTSALFQNAGEFELDLLNTISGNYLRLVAATADSYLGTIQNIPLSFIMNGSRVGQFTSTNGNLILQNGGTFIDGGERLQVNGTAKITGNTLISAGNLSIFTTNTPRRLNIEQALGGVAAAIGLYAGGGTLNSVIGIDNEPTKSLQLATTGNLIFYSGSTIGNIVTTPTNERMRLTSGGNLLVGTTSDAGDKLQVNGTSKFSLDVAISGSTGLRYASGDLGFTNTASGGQYGIYTLGTSNPTMFFDHRATGNTGTWAWRSGTGGATTAMTLSNAGAATFSSSVTATTFSIPSLSSGNGAYNFVYSGNTSSRSWRIVNDVVSFGDFAIQQSTTHTGSTYASLVYVSAGGNLLLGTTTDAGYRLDVQGTARVSGNLFGSSFFLNRTNSGGYYSGTSDNFGFWYTGSVGNISLANAQPIVFSTANQERLRITSGGNLLVGTTTDVASSKVTIESTTQGFLPPRMTNAQRTAISSPAVGLIVYCTDATEGLYQYTSAGWANLNGVVTNRQTASYTLALTDINDLVEMNVATANNLTVPLNSSVAFPIGTKIDVAQYGAGQTTVVATGGVTVRSAGGALKLAVQYSGASLVKIGTDEWYLFGDITV